LFYYLFILFISYYPIYNFYPNRMTRHTKKSSRRKKRLSSHRVRGAGYSTGPNSVHPGDLVYNSYSGTQNNLSPLKDCTGNPMSHRPGWIPSGTDMSVRGGLPGMRGGKRRRKRGGAALPYMATLDSFEGTPANQVITPPPTSFPAPNGAGGSIAQPVVAVPPGGVVPPGAHMPGTSSQVVRQSGGRYAMFPGMGPLNTSNGVGTTPGPFGRIPCEAGTFNPLNPNPGNVQGLTTAPLTPPYVTMRGGGANMAGSPMDGGSSYSAANFPTVQVGAVDSMRYYAPTAGYGHAYQTFKAPSPVPALMLNTPYDARAFNPACIKTGGSRKRRAHRSRRSRGGAPVALDASSFSSLKEGGASSRYDFDFTRKALPCQSAGARRKRRTRRYRK
jgi:hypothetical protein